jgi:hypothetical protein
LRRSAPALEALLAAQRLTEAERAVAAAPCDVVRAVAGVQAQDLRAARLAVRARLAGASRSAVDADPGIVRGWFMRGTLHWVHAEDARWLMALLGPPALRRTARRRAAMGVASDAAVMAAADAVADGPLTRQEIAEFARRRGVPLADDPQAPAWLVASAAFAGAIIEHGQRSGRPVYGRFDERVPPAPAPADPLSELGLRYRRAFPPGDAEGLARWSGLPVARCRAALPAAPGRGVRAALAAVRLLGAFDNVMLGLRDRSLVVAPEHERAVAPGGGMILATVLVDGRAAGTWKAGEVSLLAPLSGPQRRALDAELRDVERFLGS